MRPKQLFVLISCVIFIIGCAHNKPAPALILNGGMQRQACTDSLGFSGKWKLVNIHDSGRNIKPNVIDTLVINDCSTIEHYSGGRLISKEDFKLYRMRDYCADYQLIYKNDSIGCINLIIRPTGDTLIFSECSDFESARYFFKRI